MKYYAVTEDPNELLHYGVKGMKWGKHLFGDDLKPKSASYRNALGKLKAAFNKTKTQKSLSNQQKQQKQKASKIDKEQNKYNEAVKNAQRRISIVEGLAQMNRDAAYEKAAKRMYNEQRKNEIRDLKRQKNFEKNERKMDKYMQEAREGRLKYGRLSDDQVRQITDRLALERSARSLGNTENASYRLRRKEAIREGKLEGYKRGTTAAMEEVARGLVQNAFANRRVLDKKNRIEAERQREASRIRNKRSHKEMKEDFKNEVYEEKVKEGKVFGTKRAAIELKNIKNDRLEEDRKRRLEARINDELDMAGNEKYQNLLDSQREKKRAQDIQDRLANDTDEKWQRHLDSTGMSDAEARKKAGFDDDSIASASKEEADRQRRVALSKNEKTEKEAAYNKLAEEAKRRIANEEKEERNKKLEEDYSKAMEKYNEDKAYDKQLKEEYKEKVREYEVAYRKWENNQEFGDGEMKKPEPVKKPNYRNPKKPEEPKYEKLDNTPRALPSYSDYVTLRDLGINISDVISGKSNKNNNNNNNGGNGRKKPKK